MRTFPKLSRLSSFESIYKSLALAQDCRSFWVSWFCFSYLETMVVFMSRQFMGLQLLRLRFSMHSNGYKRCSILQCYHSDFPSAGSCRVIKKCVCFKVKHCLYTRSYSILHPDMWTCGPRLGTLEYAYFVIVSVILSFLSFQISFALQSTPLYPVLISCMQKMSAFIQ